MQDEHCLDSIIENILRHDTDWLEWITEKHLVKGLQDSCSKAPQRESEENQRISTINPRELQEYQTDGANTNWKSLGWGNTAPNLASRIWSLKNTHCCSCFRKKEENKNHTDAASSVAIVLFSVERSNAGGTLFVAKHVSETWWKRPILTWGICKSCGKTNGSIALCQKPCDRSKTTTVGMKQRYLRGWKEIINAALLDQIAKHVKQTCTSMTERHTGEEIICTAPETALCGEELETL